MPEIRILAQAVLQMYFVDNIALLYKMPKSGKARGGGGGIIQPNIYRILPNVDQVIYTLGTIYISNIMILAQAVFQIFSDKVEKVA